ncbi:MAG: MFS transporter [Chloroflexota bacterium]
MKRISEFIRREAIQRTIHYYLLFIYLGLAMGVYGPTLPDLASQTNSRLGQMGYIFLIGSIGFLLGNLLGGHLYDSLKSHMVSGMGQIISAALILLIPVLPSFWLLMTLILLKGIAEGLIINGGNLLLVWTHGKDVGPFLIALHFSSGLGAFLGPFIIGGLIQFPHGYQWAYWMIGVIGLIMGLKLFFLPGSPSPVNSEMGEAGSPNAAISPLIFVAALYLFFYVGIERTYSSWIYTVATTLKIFSQSGAAYLTSAFWFLFTTGRLLSIPIATRFRPQQILPFALTGCVASMALAMLLTPTTSLLWVLTIVFGFCMAPLWPMGFTLAGQSIKLTARLSTIIMLGDNFGGMLLPWIVGQVIDITGPQMVFTIVFGGSVMTFLSYLLMSHLTKRS